MDIYIIEHCHKAENVLSLLVGALSRSTSNPTYSCIKRCYVDRKCKNITGKSIHLERYLRFCFFFAFREMASSSLREFSAHVDAGHWKLSPSMNQTCSSTFLFLISWLIFFKLFYCVKQESSIFQVWPQVCLQLTKIYQLTKQRFPKPWQNYLCFLLFKERVIILYVKVLILEMAVNKFLIHSLSHNCSFKQSEIILIILPDLNQEMLSLI